MNFNTAKLLTTAILLASAATAMSQTVIKGRVVSQSSSDAIPGASVTLLKNDTVPAAQTMTAANGSFQINSDTSGNKIIAVSMTGYKPERVAVIGGEYEVTDIGYIFLSESTVNLDEITVYGSGIIEKVDKFIVLPGKDQVERSARSIDLFAQLDLPGLRTDPILERVTVEDRTPVYQINGRQQPLKRILNLDPKDVLRIEYSNNPGIRYIDKGYSGIINVVLRDKQQGGSIYGSAQSAVWEKFINGNLQGSFNYKKSEFILSYNGSWRDYDKWKNNASESFISPDATISRDQYGYNSYMYYQNHSASLEYNFIPKLNTLFSARFSQFYYDGENDIRNRMEEKPWEGTPFNYEEHRRQTSGNTSSTLDLFFSTKLRNRQSIEINAVGNYANNRYNRNLDYIHPSATESLPLRGDGHGWGAAGEAVYNKEFDRVVARFGVQHTYTYDKNTYDDGQMSVQKKNNTYAYGEVRGKISTLQYSLGTGLKVFTTENNAESKTHLANNTVVTLLFPLAKKWNVNYALMYQPTMPTLSMLSPVVQSSNDRVFYTGNPSLKPSNWLYNRAWIRYNNNKGMTWSFWLKYGRTFNPMVQTYSFIPSENYFLRRPNNENYDDNYEIQVNFGYQNILNHLNIYAEFGFTRYVTDGASYHHTHNNFFSSLQLQAYFGKWTFSGNMNITPRSALSGETIKEQGRNTTLSLQYKVNNNLYFWASVWYPFDKKGWISKRENLSGVNPQWSETTIRNNANMLMLGLSFNLNYGKKLSKGKRTLKNTGYESGQSQF